MSWKSLDKTREETKAAIEKDLDEMDRLMRQQQKVASRISKHRKVLKLAEERARRKTSCLLDELEEEEEMERVKNGGLSNGELRELANDFVAYNNAGSENLGKEISSAWDQDNLVTPEASVVSSSESSGVIPVA